MDTCKKKPPEGTFEPGKDKAFTREKRMTVLR